MSVNDSLAEKLNQSEIIWKNKKRESMKKLTVVLGIVAGFAASNVKADFSGYYQVPGWPPPSTLSAVGTYANLNGGTWTIAKVPGLPNYNTSSYVSASSFSQIGMNGSSDGRADSMAFTIPAFYTVANGHGFSFSYDCNVLHGVNEQFGYIIGATEYPLVNSGSSGVGTMLVEVPTGTAFGWYVHSDGGSQQFPAPAVTISLFEQVPEPSSIAMSAIAGLGVVGYAWRARRAKNATK